MSEKSPPVRLLVATMNPKKLKELHELLDGLSIQLVSLKDFPEVKEVEESGTTFAENARLKAVGYAVQTGLLTLGEDSGLCCDALDGAPGVMSARFSGLHKDDDANNRKVLELLKGIPNEKRAAYYTSVIALAEPDKVIAEVSGEVHGFINCEPKGSGGFGYDPIFFYPPFAKTFGEVPASQKHKVSHRSRALEKLRKVLQTYLPAQ